MEKLPARWTITSLAVFFAVVGIACVLCGPIFPKNRKANDAVRNFGTGLYLLGSLFLIFESKETLKKLPNKMWKKLKKWYNKLCGCACGRKLDEEEDHEEQPHCHHNLLAYCFYAGLVANILWDLINQTHYALHQPECFELPSIFYNVTKFIFASLILVTILFLDPSEIEPTTVPRRVSMIGWSSLSAVCFSTAFKYTIEDDIWGYLGISKKCLHEPDHCGWDIGNATTTEEMVEKIFQRRAHCINYAYFPGWVENSLPFSIEFFSLATVFCVIKWVHSNSEEGARKREPPVRPVQDPPHTSDEAKWFSNQWIWIGALLVVATLTITSILVYNHEMESERNVNGVWIFLSQQFSLQFALLIPQITFYFAHMHKMNYVPQPSNHYQLESWLLNAPFLPLSILWAVRALPDLIHLIDPIKNIPLYDRQPVWILLNTVVIFFNLIQVFIQAMFISELYCRIDHGGLRKSIRHFFLYLAAVNLCIWGSWTFESRSLTIDGRDEGSRVFGLVPWNNTVNATVPFALFSIAHATTCFFWMWKRVGQPSKAHSNAVAQGKDVISFGNELVGLGQELVAKGQGMLTLDKGDALVVLGDALIAQGSELIFHGTELVAQGSDVITTRSRNNAASPQNPIVHAVEVRENGSLEFSPVGRNNSLVTVPLLQHNSTP